MPAGGQQIAESHGGTLSVAEDAAVNAGIEADPDTLEVTDEMAAQMRPFRRAGRPPLESPKEPVTMRVDADVLATIKATGRG
ncbi:BrnA antitoxin family protein [uncultured Pseudacidovorax sp.]|uniref:BrnA antitoxin family protein n=1 Tax=uncultured Pseudacidovorax sp. TaxID=679313 RepID=UPI0025FB8F9F|nr:BrnA antitoxin family protein [uncultured Pseudacidovorax sp.]